MLLIETLPNKNCQVKNFIYNKNIHPIISVVDAEGLSCSGYIEPTNEFITFKGSNYANFDNTFSFYILPDSTVETDPATALLSTYFDTSAKTTKPAFYTALSASTIDFVSTLSYSYSFTNTQAMKSTGPVVMPVLQSYTSGYDFEDGIATIEMTNFVMTAKGSVYAIAREIATITTDPQDEFETIDTPVRAYRTPSHTQINNCLDWNGEAVDACAKAVIANSDNVELLLKNLKSNTVYIVYYTVANEYPIEPVFSDAIESFEIRVLGAARLLVNGALILAMLFVCLFV